MHLQQSWSHCDEYEQKLSMGMYAFVVPQMQLVQLLSGQLPPHVELLPSHKKRSISTITFITYANKLKSSLNGFYLSLNDVKDMSWYRY
jgi:hypothetical protein